MDSFLIPLSYTGSQIYHKIVSKTIIQFIELGSNTWNLKFVQCLLKEIRTQTETNFNISQEKLDAENSNDIFTSIINLGRILLILESILSCDAGFIAILSVIKEFSMDNINDVEVDRWIFYLKHIWQFFRPWSIGLTEISLNILNIIWNDNHSKKDYILNVPFSQIAIKLILEIYPFIISDCNTEQGSIIKQTPSLKFITLLNNTIKNQPDNVLSLIKFMDENFNQISWFPKWDFSDIEMVEICSTYFIYLNVVAFEKFQFLDIENCDINQDIIIKKIKFFHEFILFNNKICQTFHGYLSKFKDHLSSNTNFSTEQTFLHTQINQLIQLDKTIVSKLSFLNDKTISDQWLIVSIVLKKMINNFENLFSLYDPVIMNGHIRDLVKLRSSKCLHYFDNLQQNEIINQSSSENVTHQGNLIKSQLNRCCIKIFYYRYRTKLKNEKYNIE